MKIFARKRMFCTIHGAARSWSEKSQNDGWYSALVSLCYWSQNSIKTEDEIEGHIRPCSRKKIFQFSDLQATIPAEVLERERESERERE